MGALHAIYRSLFDGRASSRERRLAAEIETLQAERDRLEAELDARTQSLADAEERFADYAEMSSEWFWEQDENLRFSEASKGIRAATGIKPQDYEGRTRRETNIGGVTESDLDAHEALLARREPFEDFRYTRERPDGGLVHIGIRGKPIFDKTGAFKGYRGTGQNLTPTTEARLETEQNHRRFAEAIDSMTEGFALYAADGALTFCNDTFRRLNPDLGTTLAPLPEADEADGDGGDLGGSANAPLRRNGRWLIENRSTLSDGSTVVVIFDVTDLKDRESTIVARERQFRDFAELSADWYWEIDADLRMTYMSQKFDTVGVDPSSVLGSDRVEIGAAAGTEDPMLVAISARAPFRGIEQRSVFNPNVWVSISGKPLYDDAGRFQGYRGVTRNVTQNKNLIERIEIERAMYEAILDAVPVAITLVDAEGRLVFCNQLQGDRWDYDPYRAIGKRFYDLVTPEAAEWVETLDKQVLDTGKAIPFTQFVDPAFSTERAILLSKIPIPLADHERPGVCTIIADITDRVEAERDRHEAELKLAKSQRLESVGQLTGGVAHDFNNILSVVLGNVELLSDMAAADPKAEASLEAIQRSVRRGADLVDRLLSYARQQPLAARTTDVSAVVRDIELLLDRTLGANVQLRVEAADDLWAARTDASQLENALVNLAINARDAMPDGGELAIHVANRTVSAGEARPDDDFPPGDYVGISVVDSGVGISAEDLPRIFDPFFTTKEVGKGSGLGLSMVYGFVKQSGGHVTVESAPGAGATVHLFLPRAGQGSKPGVDGPPDKVDAGSGERILVVEDDDALREIPIKVLTASGYVVRGAANGPEAVAALDSGERFDLLFTDLMLPGGMNGVEIADALQSVDAGMKVVFTTGYARSARDDIERRRPDAKVLAKPYRAADLLAAVNEAIHG